MLEQRTRSRAVVLAVLVLTLLGCSSSLQSEVVIHAPPDRVWSVLTDFAEYPEWNPFFEEIP